MDLAEHPPLVPPEAAAPPRPADRVLERCLARLPDGQREALRLTLATGATYREVAQRLQVSDEIVKERIRSGLGTLRLLLEASGWTFASSTDLRWMC